MWKTLALVGLLAACKTDDAPKPAASSPAEPASNAKPRSGKIDLPTPPARPATPPPKLAEDDPRLEGIPVSEQSREERRRQRMAMFDTDGDGVISDEERAAGRAAREAALQERLDTNKDGVVSDEERAAARRDRATNMHARFDRDGDGKLTAQEIEQAPFARFGPSADANGDGEITVEELDTAMKERRRWRGGRGQGSGAPPQ
jgi:Ca2+-binding EF-hand superfamily protein